MFGVLLGGFLPSLILRIVRYYALINFRFARAFAIWAQVALLLDMIDLFLYNHGVRKYLIALCRRE